MHPGGEGPGQEQPPQHGKERGKDHRPEIADHRREQAVGDIADGETQRGTDRPPEAAAPQKPGREEGNRGREIQELRREELGKQDRAQRHEKHHEGQDRAPAKLFWVEPEQKLRPAFVDHRPAGTGGSVLPNRPGFAQDCAAVVQRGGIPCRRPEPGNDRGKNKIDRRDGNDGQDRVQPAVEQVFAHPADHPDLANRRRLFGKHLGAEIG